MLNLVKVISSMWPALGRHFSVWGHGDSGVGVTLVVRLQLLMVKGDVGGEVVGSVNDRGLIRWPGHRLVTLYKSDHFRVGVTLEVRLHRFAGTVNRGGEAGKKPRLRSARRGIKILGS